MKRCALLAICLISCPAFGSVLFFGGDPVVQHREFVVGSPAGVQDEVYDDFELQGTSRITSLFADVYQMTTPVGQRRARFEIRSNVSAGNSGNLIASGAGLAISMEALTNGIPSTRPFFRYRASGLNIEIAPGRYWLMMYFDHFVEIAETYGANGIGQPLGNANAYLTSVFRGNAYFKPIVATAFPAPDFAYGVEGAVVPEPVTITFLSLGLISTIRPRRRQKSCAGV